MKEKISVIGIGRLGLSFALLLDEKGYDVMGCDVNEKYIQSLKNKTFKSDEPQINEMFGTCNINFTTSSADAFNFSSVIFIFVPTPSKENGEYDHQYIKQVITEFEKEKLYFKTIVISCTVFPNYCATLQKRLAGLKVNVVYIPTLIAQGSICKDLKNADVVLVGGKMPMIIHDIYKAIMGRTPNFKFLSLTGAEVAKISINCFLSLKISYANLLGSVCLNSGISEEEMRSVLFSVGSDSRVGDKFLSFGFPASGVCVLPTQDTITKRGVLQIKDVVVGDYVLSHDGKFNKITKIFTRDYDGDMCRFKLEGFSTDELIITPEHPIWGAKRTTNRRYELFNPNKLKPMDKKQHDLLEVDFIEAAKLEHGDFFSMPRLKTEKSTIQYLEIDACKGKAALKIELTPDVLRLLGYFFAEGSTDGGERFSFTFNDNEVAFHDDVMYLTENYFGVKGVKTMLPERKTCKIRGYSPQITEYFNSVFLKGCQNLKIPYEWLELSDEHLTQFLRGFWYGDGSSSTGVFSCATISKEIFTFNKLALNRLGIYFITAIREPRKSKDGVNHKRVYTIRINKREGIERFNQIIPLKAIDMSTCSRGEKNTAFWKDGKFIYHIKKKEIIHYDGVVYNIEVENSNSYMLTNATVHNCLPRDTRALNVYLEKIGIDKSLINGIHDANNSHMMYLKERIVKNADKNKPIPINQLSYKPNVPIITESKHLELCIMLLKEGYKVEITESESVILQAKTILQEWSDQINYIVK